MLGGFSRKEGKNIFLKSSFYLDVAKSSFHVIPNDMSDPRINSCCHLYEKQAKMIVGGGSTTGWQNLLSVELLDLKTFKWRVVQKTPFAGYFANSFAIFDRLIFFNKSVAYEYNLQEDKWMNNDNIARPNFVTAWGMIDVSQAKICSKQSTTIT